MYAALHESLLNVRHRVCGYRLQPFSYDHFEALQAMGHPILARERVRMRSVDLFAALRILASTGEQLETNMPPARPRLRDCWHVFRHAVSTRQLQRDIQKLQAYFADHAAAPETMERLRTEDQGIQDCGLPSFPPLFGKLTAVLIGYKGAISERRARSMPIGLLMHYWELLLHHNRQGAPFVDPEADAAIEAGLAQAEAEAAKLIQTQEKS